jgi:hypothetical protein
MHASEYNLLREKSLREPLTAAEELQLQAHFLEHPADQAVWEEEAALTHLLRELPDAPVATNFTARVLAEVALAEARPRSRSLATLWESLGRFAWPRIATASFLLLACATLLIGQRQYDSRAERAASLAVLSDVAKLPSVEMLRDFYAMRLSPGSLARRSAGGADFNPKSAGPHPGEAIEPTPSLPPEAPELAVQAAAPAEMRGKLERDLERWQTLPLDRRQRMLVQFNQFFDLNEREKARTLSILSVQERQSIERMLMDLGKLPPAERNQCVKSFIEFASMTPENQLVMLRSAQRWQAMTAEERQAQRVLVHQLPPMPPGAGEPPLPPTFGEPPSSIPPTLPVARGK